MISCRDFMDEIGNYLEGDLAEDIRRRLEAHLAHCTTCTIICDSARKTIQVVTDSESFDLTDDAFRPLAEGIMSRIRQSQSEPDVLA